MIVHHAAIGMNTTSCRSSKNYFTHHSITETPISLTFAAGFPCVMHPAAQPHVSTGITGSRNHQLQGEPGLESLFARDAVRTGPGPSMIRARYSYRKTTIGSTLVARREGM
jgi:hypothetical protein